MTTIGQMPRKILLSTDLSARCDRAMDRAVQLAEQWKADLVVAHAVMGEDVVMREADGRIPSWRRGPDAQDIAERQLRSDLGQIGVNVKIIVEPGEPGEVVLRAAKAQGCDLIMTGIARDEPLGRFLLGSTVDRLLRQADIPVLVVRDRVRHPYNHVAVAVDFSDSARRALESADRLFPRHPLTVFHAYDAPKSGRMTDSDSYQREYRKVVEQDFEAFLQKAELSADRKKGLLRLSERGDPARLLRDYTRDRRIDLIVLGSLGRGFLKEALIGNTAKAIIDGLPCDALIVR